MKIQHFYSHGKLLITGEYVILDGAKALAIPCQFGQHLEVRTAQNDISTWLSYDYQNHIWLELEFDIFDVIENRLKGTNEVENRLYQIFREANRINPNVFTQNYAFKTHLEFPENWGLGTSSTLIANLAKWVDVDPYLLLSKSFGGSGYDIACADSDTALVYALENASSKVEAAKISDFIKPYLYFVYLEQKQNSREAIDNYRKNKPSHLDEFISKINNITEEFQEVLSLDKAHELIQNHEIYLSEILKIEPVKSRLFPDFKGSVKSLGAWGGDFIMVVSDNDPSKYFENKGFKTVLKFEDMAL